MNFKRNLFILIILTMFILSFNMVSADEDLDNLTVDANDNIDSVIVYPDDNVELADDLLGMESTHDELKNTDEVIIVNDWDELQYYCAQTDKDYTLKLKENTNFYPEEVYGDHQQIKIKNNVKILGSEGSWFGDNSSNAKQLRFLAILVEDNAKVGLTLENVEFKWIRAGGGNRLPDGMFIKIGGKKNTLIKNCQFSDIVTQYGHSCLIHLNKGKATFDNCSFINCTDNYGILSVYNPNGENPSMIVQNCYFENNYGSTEPGCINNCGKLTVYNTTFVKNRSFWWAGAIHTHCNANTTIYDSNFIDNVAGWNGGALYTYSHLQIYNSVFSGNNCTTNNGGGAIGACDYESNPHLYVEGCLFENNANNCWSLDSLSTEGIGRGGAISFMDAGSLEVRDTIFIANSASIGTAICARAVRNYGSPDVIIVNNTFINHTRADDTLNVEIWDTIKSINDNYYYGNSIVFSNLTLSKLYEGKEQAKFEIVVSLANPTYYDEDILDKTLYDVYINNKYVKTVNTTVFTVDFGDLDICDVYVIPTISNRKSNEVTITSTREYVFVSKSNGNDNNNGISRDTPVSTIKRALELARNCQNIILLDGDFSESNIQIDYGVTIKGEGNATLTGTTSFIANSNFTLKNLKINKLNTENFINQNNNNLFISNCIFTDNDAVLVYNNGFTSLTNSILINNSQVITGNVNDCVLDYNWWGNVPSTLNNYITLNLTSDVNALENNHKANVKAVFYLNDGSKYTKLPEINLDINVVNGVVNQNNVNIDSEIIYTLTAFEDGVLTVSYNNVNVTKSFEFLKSDPDISLACGDVMVANSVSVTVSTPSDAGGNLTCIIGNLSQTKEIQSKVTTFIFDNLKADTYTISLSYSGDRKYLSKDLTSSVNVNKYESATDLNISTVNVGDDVIVTVTVTDSATGNVTMSVNNNIQTLTLTNSKALYTIENINRGDYLICAVYNGDEKYLTSENSIFIEVDNLNASMTVEAEDITYGDKAVVKVNLNDDATGKVIVTIDGITNSSIVSNGKAEVSFTNLEAGSYKNITVFYSGDDTYFNLTKSGTFNIAKADLIFSIGSKDIKIGQFAEITIVVPQKTTGTFTINNDTINIPLSGEISYVIGDLEIGNYTYTAVYNGNNYNTVSKSTSFEVTEYAAPQWANEGSNTENTHKSPYGTETNGEIAFIILFNETLSGDLAIDSKGNLYLTTKKGVHCFNQTNRLWYFTSDVAAGYLSGIAIGRDVVIAPKSGDTLYFINQTTGERFGESNIYQGSSFYAPVIDSNATLYIVSEYQFTSEDYKLTVIPYRLWEKGGDPTLVSIGNTQPICSPTVNENIIVVLTENYLRLIDAKTLDTISIKQGNYLPVRPIIGEGNIIYTVLSDSIVAYNANAVQVWKTKVTGGVGDRLVLDSEQGVYHVNARNILYRYNLIDGSQSKVSNVKVTSGILIGSDGILYFGSNNVFYAIDSEGNILWKSDLESKIIGNPVMDKTGLIYVPIEKGIVALTYASLADCGLKVKVDDIVEGQKAEITITLNGQATGVISYVVNGEEFTASAEDAKIIKIIPDLEIGYYDVSVSYSGDMRFKPCNVNKKFVVRSVDDVANNIEFDGNSTFSFNLNNSEGNLTVKINDKIYSKVLVNGQTSIIVDDLAPGEYEALVIYSGDKIYSKANRTFSLSVPKFSVNLNENIITENMVSTISVELPVNATGNVTLSVGTKKYSGKINNGGAVIVVDDLAAGNYAATLKYSGDSNYESASKSVNINPTKIPVILDDSNVFVQSGEQANISIKLNDDASGKFTVSVDGVEYSSDISDVIVISDLDAGKYSATLTYSGDNRYEKASYAITFEIINATVVDNATEDNSTGWDNSTNTTVKKNVTIMLSAEDITVGDDAVIDVKSSEGSIKITVTVNNKEYAIVGSGNFNVSGLASGNYTVVARFAGDDAFNEAVNSTIFNVLKVILPVGDETIIIPDDNSGKYSISLPGDATGTLTVTVDGKAYTEKLVDGKATVNVPELDEGSHNITLTYSGDVKYAPITKSSTVVVNGSSANGTDSNSTVIDGNTTNSTGGNGTAVDNSTNGTVEKADPALLIDVGDVNAGDNAVIIISTSVSSGKVVVSLNNKDYNLVVSSGQASISISDLAVGKYEVVVRFDGDDSFNGVVNSSSFNVLKVSVPVTNETISVPDSSSTEYSISLPSDATGTLTVTVDGKNYTQKLVNGKATVSIPELASGTHNITVAYSGDAKYSPIVKSTVVVKQPVINLTGSNLNMLYQSGKYFKVRLTSDGQPLAGKIVKIIINGKTYSKKTGADGYASLKINLSPKVYTADVTYGDLKLTKKVTVKTVIKAKNINAKKSAKTVKVKITLKKVNGKYLKNKKVTLKFNKKTYKLKTNKKGVVTFTIKKNVYNKLKVGKKYTYQVIYGKDKVKKTIKFKK